MKFFFFVLASLSAIAIGADDNRIYREGFEVLKNPANAVNNVLCKSDDPNAPWCANLSKYACTIKKNSNLVGSLDQSIKDRFTGKLNSSTSPKIVVDTYYNAIKASENEVFGQSLAKRPDVVQVFMDTKTTMRMAITSNPQIPRATQTKMANAIMAIDMRTGTEYIDELAARIKKQLPNENNEKIRASAIEVYQSSCGEHGLDVNAFFDSGKLVICPGLVYSLSDYGPKNKSDVMDALSFTIGHEMGHAIDAAEMPEVYSNMRACYVGMTNNPKIWEEDIAAEISADYWGSLVLSNRLRNNGVRGKDAAKAVALATDGFCSDSPTVDGHPEHPTGEFRVNATMSTFPAMREALSCEGPTNNSPACMINGRVPR